MQWQMNLIFLANYWKNGFQAYWQQKGLSPQRFCDIGCGNGLLVHLLQKMKVVFLGIAFLWRVRNLLKKDFSLSFLIRIRKTSWFYQMQ